MLLHAFWFFIVANILVYRKSRDEVRIFSINFISQVLELNNTASDDLRTIWIFESWADIPFCTKCAKEMINDPDFQSQSFHSLLPEDTHNFNYMECGRCNLVVTSGGFAKIDLFEMDRPDRLNWYEQYYQLRDCWSPERYDELGHLEVYY